jgi:hypothetical protein
MSDEQLHADAEKAVAEQTTTRRRYAIDETPDGDLLVLTKTERAALVRMIDLSHTIRKRASGTTKELGLKLAPLLQELNNAYRVHDAAIAKPKPKAE